MPTPDPPVNRSPRSVQAWVAVLSFVGGCVLVLVIYRGVGLPGSRNTALSPPSSNRTSRFSSVGLKSCSVCHPGEYASHSVSGHARTLRAAAKSPLARRLSGATFADPEAPGVSWTYGLSDGRFWVERCEAERVEQFPIDYAFGSGRHATTFVTLTERTPDRPRMFEHRLTVFAHQESPEITPGQGKARRSTIQGVEPSGRSYQTQQTLKCFECHTTAISDRGPLLLDETTMIPNIGCERCHGPGKEHVEAAHRRAGDEALKMPFGRGRWSAADEMRLCGGCHRLPETVGSDMISPDNPTLVRFQPVGLMQSACYQKSQGALSCSTCHEPHARSSTDLPAYEAVCLSCHSGPSQTACKVSRVTGCVGCHMPRRDASRGMMMIDHWIRSRP